MGYISMRYIRGGTAGGGLGYIVTGETPEPKTELSGSVVLQTVFSGTTSLQTVFSGTVKMAQDE